MGDAFSHFTKIIRFLASGMVALVAAHMFNHQCLKTLYTDLGTDSWWPILFLAATIGLLLQALNATLMWWTFPAMLKLKIVEGTRDFRWYNQQRWLRRASSDPRMQVLQQEIDTWGALIIFLYCSALALILTSLVMLRVLKIENNNLPWHVILLAGVALQVLTLVGDGFKLSRECWISDKRPEDDPTHPKRDGVSLSTTLTAAP